MSGETKNSGAVSFHRHFTPARIRRTVALGFKSLWLHKLRSLLTVLGIVFGVCSVIAMLAVGEGASFEAQEQIRRLGSNNIILNSLKPQGDTNSAARRSYVVEYGLTYADIRRIQDTIPGVTVVVPGRTIRKFFWNQTRQMDGEVVGTVPWFPEMRKVTVLMGRFFTDAETEQQTNVCVLSKSVYDELFPLWEPLGASLKVGSDYYRVVGVVEDESNGAKPQGDGAAKSGESAPSGATTNNAGQTATLSRIYIPITAAKSRFGEVLMKRRSGSFEAEKVELHEATVQVHLQEEVQEISLIVKELLAKYHPKDDYTITVPLELLRQAERTKQIFNIVLGAIAAISLLVGGIGIMNIMLASVTERTREIGIRRALGARRRDIIFQFLIETVILSGTGGIIGVILGIAIPFFITYFAEMRTIVTPTAPVIAFSISGLVGIIFGIYPAIRAADMDPVEALRHE